MTRDEIIDLLSYLAAADKRTVGTIDVEVWSDAAARARWTFDEALEAAKQHVATNPDMAKPAHINELIKAERRQPPRYNRLALRGGPLPATDQTRDAAMNEIRRTLDRPDAVAVAGPDPMAGGS